MFIHRCSKCSFKIHNYIMFFLPNVFFKAFRLSFYKKKSKNCYLRIYCTKSRTKAPCLRGDIAMLQMVLNVIEGEQKAS